jgi:hypothetical protein
MQTLTSYEPITPKQSKLVFSGDNYYEWSEDMKTYLEGKNLLMCIEHKNYEEYLETKRESIEKIFN